MVISRNYFNFKNFEFIASRFRLYNMNDNDNLNLENPFSEPLEMEITDSLDLHAFLPRDVKSVVEVYLEEAKKKGFRIVRIIHGKGIGVQREAVRKILSKTDFVKSFKTANEMSGSWGATVVEFK